VFISDFALAAEERPITRLDISAIEMRQELHRPRTAAHRKFNVFIQIAHAVSELSVRAGAAIKGAAPAERAWVIRVLRFDSS
jgi:hypothetical protein